MPRSPEIKLTDDSAAVGLLVCQNRVLGFIPTYGGVRELLLEKEALAIDHSRDLGGL